MTKDPKQAELVTRTSVLSDPVEVGLAMYELMTTDLRQAVAAIRTPTLLVAAGGQVTDEKTRSELERRSQVESIPQHRVVVATHAKHFIMLDDPAFLFSQIDEFLAGAGG